MKYFLRSAYLLNQWLIKTLKLLKLQPSYYDVMDSNDAKINFVHDVSRHQRYSYIISISDISDIIIKNQPKQKQQFKSFVGICKM